MHYLRSFADSQAIIARAGTREARGRDRRQLHRPRGGGLAARARHRRGRGRAGAAAARARARARSSGEFVRALHEEHGCRLPSGRDGRARRRARRDPERRQRRSTPTSWCSASACGRRLALAERAGLAMDRGIVGERVPRDQRARGVRGRRRRALARSAHRRERSASSTGWWRSARARSPRGTCSAAARRSTRCRSSGASTTTSRSTTSATPRSGTPSRSTGDPGALDCAVRYKLAGRVLAVATIGRDLESLRSEAAMESGSAS